MSSLGSYTPPSSAALKKAAKVSAACSALSFFFHGFIVNLPSKFQLGYSSAGIGLPLSIL